LELVREDPAIFRDFIESRKRELAIVGEEDDDEQRVEPADVIESFRDAFDRPGVDAR
jgi:hypothetical protein